MTTIERSLGFDDIDSESVRVFGDLHSKDLNDEDHLGIEHQ